MAVSPSQSPASVKGFSSPGVGTNRSEILKRRVGGICDVGPIVDEGERSGEFDTGVMKSFEQVEMP